MNFINPDSIITMPLSLKNHQTAEKFGQQHTNTQKAKQVYRNTLAVQAVNAYLEWMSIETDLEASRSWNPIFQELADVADLKVKEQGSLECRPVMPDAEVCQIPPEVWSERIGFVAVQLNEALTEATLLGFVPTVTTSELPLKDLRPLEELLDVLTPSIAPVKEPSLAKGAVSLKNWLQGILEESWQTIDTLFEVPQFAFRHGGAGNRGTQEASSEPIETVVEASGGKLLTIGSYTEGEQVALVMGISPETDEEVDVWVAACPTGEQMHLPEDLKLSVLDAEDKVVMMSEARQSEMLQMRFSITLGEQFGIQVGLGDINIVEKFVV